MLLFSNNAEATLAAALPGSYSDTEITVTESGQAAGFATPASGQWQLATLTDTSLPGMFEVVRITERTGTVFVVERGHELPQGVSSLQSWPAGTKLSARVTAKTLEAFAQAQYLEPPVTYSDPDTGVFYFTSIPRLEQRRYQSGTGLDSMFAPEVVGWSHPIDLGAPATWTTSPQGVNAVVAPTVPDGCQYWLDLTSFTVSASYTDIEPDFAGVGGPTIAYNGTAPDRQEVGFWVPNPSPASTSAFFSGKKLVLTEVGFVAFQVSATSTPSVDIAENSSATPLLAGQALSQITGSGQIHRIPIAAGGPLLSGIHMKVATAATGGVFRGRFYWRGFFLDTYE